METEKIETLFTALLEKHVGEGVSNQISRPRNNASDLGFECDTYQAAVRLKGHLRPEISLSKALMASSNRAFIISKLQSDGSCSIVLN